LPADSGLSLVGSLAYLSLLAGLCGLSRASRQRRKRTVRPFSPGLVLLLAYLLPVWVSWLPQVVSDAITQTGQTPGPGTFAPAWYPWLPILQASALLVLLLAGGEFASFKAAPLNLRRLTEAGLWGLGAWLLLVFTYRLSTHLIPALGLAERAATLPLIAGLNAAAGVLLLPLGEELFFRGRLITAQPTRSADQASSLLSAVFFGLANPHPALWLPAFLVGIGMNVLARRPRGLWLAILAHSLLNLLLLVVLPGLLI
jgi:membrane protease YdiL (CAAX protease family)